VKNKGRRFEVVTLVAQCSRNDVKFFIICGVVEFWTTEILTEVGYGLPELSKHSSNAYPIGITLDLK